MQGDDHGRERLDTRFPILDLPSEQTNTREVSCTSPPHLWGTRQRRSPIPPSVVGLPATGLPLRDRVKEDRGGSMERLEAIDHEDYLQPTGNPPRLQVGVRDLSSDLRCTRRPTAPHHRAGEPGEDAGVGAGDQARKTLLEPGPRRAGQSPSCFPTTLLLPKAAKASLLTRRDGAPAD